MHNKGGSAYLMVNEGFQIQAVLISNIDPTDVEPVDERLYGFRVTSRGCRKSQYAKIGIFCR
jgi:hypothetical protein